MVITTRKQREALKRVFDRAPQFATVVDSYNNNPMTYRQFRGLVQPTFGCDNAVVVPWAGMWLIIETDGYTHS